MKKIFDKSMKIFLESIKKLMKKDSYVDHLSKPCQNKDYVNGVNKLLEKALATQELSQSTGEE